MRVELVEPEVTRILAAHAEETERQARPAAESLTAVRGAGVLAAAAPAASGGRDLGVGTTARVFAELAGACPATAYVANTTAAAKRIVAVVFGDAAPEFFADPDAICAAARFGGRGVTEADGVRVSGRWTEMAGCEDAAWVALGAVVGGELLVSLVPKAELTVERNWDAAGMPGTGAHAVVAEDVLVPRHRTAPVAVWSAADFAFFALNAFATVVGATRGALVAATAMFTSGPPAAITMSRYSRMGDSPTARQWLAEATLLVERAERTMTDLADAAEAEPPTGPMTGPGTARMQLELGYSVRDCQAALDRMLDLFGMGERNAFAGSNPLQRFWRDVSVASRHPYFNTYRSAERYSETLVP